MYKKIFMLISAEHEILKAGSWSFEYIIILLLSTFPTRVCIHVHVYVLIL